jgi:hypothetical protein
MKTSLTARVELKKEASRVIDTAVARFLATGGTVTVVKPRVAKPGARTWKR